MKIMKQIKEDYLLKLIETGALESQMFKKPFMVYHL